MSFVRRSVTVATVSALLLFGTGIATAQAQPADDHGGLISMVVESDGSMVIKGGSYFYFDISILPGDLLPGDLLPGDLLPGGGR
ncbi:hypothetical protein ACR820_05415 [Streptomyces netropsis]